MGFKKENDRNIPLSAPERNYRDASHKPEILLALTPFRALCGLRSITETKALFALLGTDAANPIIERLDSDGSYLSFFRYLYSLEGNERELFLKIIHGRIEGLSENPAIPKYAREAFKACAPLFSAFHGDAGAISPLYLNILELEPGNAIYLPAGIMHTYLGGTGLELMANSDNVLRGGLTSKHIDIPELLSVLDPRPYKPEILSSPDEPGLHSFATPAREFKISVLTPAGTSGFFTADTPMILVCGTDARVALEAAGEAIMLSRGASVFIPASGVDIRYSGWGTAFMASLPARGVRK